MLLTDGQNDLFSKGTHSVFNYHTVFISDLHLGSRKTATPYLYEFLTHLDLDSLKNLYIVGDLIGGWEIMGMKQQPFPEMERRIFDVLNYAAGKGVNIHIIPGNHDEKLRPLLNTLQNRRSRSTFSKHVTFENESYFDIKADGKTINKDIRLKIVHGDQHDPDLFMKPWFRPLTYLTSNIYDGMVKLNYHVSGFLYKYFGIHVSLAKRFKNGFKKTIDFFFSHDALLKGLEGKPFDGVLMGHTHMAGIQTFSNNKGEKSWLINDGDWVESASFAAIDKDGKGLPQIHDYKRLREERGFGELPDEDDEHPEHLQAMRDKTNRQIRHVHSLWRARNYTHQIAKLHKSRHHLAQYKKDYSALSGIMHEVHNTNKLSEEARETLSTIFDRTKQQSYKIQKNGLKRIFNLYSAGQTIENESDLLFIKTVIREFGLRCERKIRKHKESISKALYKLDINP